MQLFKKILLLAPCLAISMVTMSPSKAATLASSEAEFLFTEFSQNPSTVFTDLDSDVTAIEISESAQLFTEVNKEAIFIVDNPVAYNASSSFAVGELGDYLGTAKSEATVQGVFDIEADSNFSFDFFGDLGLDTSIDNPFKESARASGDVSFALIDTSNNQTLDFFSLEGNVTTAGDNDFIVYNNSENVFLEDNVTITDFDFGGKQEFAKATIFGFYERYFATDTTLALVEVKRTKAEVAAVPEPSTSPALFIATLTLFSCCGLMVKSKSNQVIKFKYME